jgi:hypothetical protein
VVDPHVERKQQCLERFLTALTSLCTPSEGMVMPTYQDLKLDRGALQLSLAQRVSFVKMECQMPFKVGVEAINAHGTTNTT